MITMGYMEARNDHMSAADDGVVLDIMDLGTGFVGIFPVKSRPAVETTRAARHFLGCKERQVVFIRSALTSSLPRHVRWHSRATILKQVDHR